MSPGVFKQRTKAYALKIIHFTDNLPTSRANNVMAGQLLRCGTSVGANYRAACRSKSAADFISKMGIVVEECDESIYWMELLEDSGKIKKSAVAELKQEGSEILAMVVASINTARSHRGNPQSAIRNPQSK